jgi:UDP-GlcNAc:undecaprenyl-phosphate GlcNAc-1-phosphate transferase
VATADKEHLHHRLMDLGHGHRRTVVILWAWTAVLSGFVLVPAFTSRGNGIVPIGLTALALLLFTLFAPRIVRRASRGDASASDLDAAANDEDEPDDEAAPTTSEVG